LLVADIAPVRYDQGGEHRTMIEALLAVALENQTRAQIDEQVRAAIPDASIRNFLLQNLIRSKTGWHWRLNLAGLQNALPDLRGFPESDSTYPKSTLFIRGERSAYVLPGHRAEIRLRFPKHQLVTLKNAGHWLHVEQPEAFQSTVRSFLNHLSTPNP
jgi:pimeloyl-ACP methyl ester carboxylesterase